DCGRWPGGEVTLTWKQWRALEPGAYLSVARAGSGTARVLSELPAAAGSAGSSVPTGPRLLQVASAALTHLHLWGLERDASLFALLKGHVFAYAPQGPVSC